MKQHDIFELRQWDRSAAAKTTAHPRVSINRPPHAVLFSILLNYPPRKHFFGEKRGLVLIEF
jgi:hypothetical protein